MVLLNLALTLEMEGPEVPEEMLKMDSDVGIISVTGVYSEDVLEEAVEKGAYSFPKKPFDLQYLEKVVLTRLLLSSKN